MCFEKHIKKKTFFDKKNLGNRLYSKDDIIIFLFLEKINISNRLKQNFECGLLATVCRVPALYTYIT